MPSTTSPNMGLVVPTVAQEPGPTWANDLNADLGILDQHNHSSGQGVRINPSGLDINGDLPINGNNLTTVKTVNFSAQVSFLPGTSPNLGCIYVAGNELYYNDEAGNVVPITLNGSVNAGAGSISGLPSGTASASYSGAGQTFTWQSATVTPANMDFGSAVLRNILPNSFGLTLSPPNSLAADYSVTLPASNTSGGTVFLTYDTSNNMGAGPLLANGITNSNIASHTILQSNLALMTTGSTVGAGGFAVSGSSGTFSTTSGTYVQVTNLSVTITTTGRPVHLAIQPDGSGNPASINYVGTASSVFLGVFRGVTAIFEHQLAPTNNGGAQNSNWFLPPLGDDPVAAGTYTYTVQAYVLGPPVIGVNYCNLIAYEI